MRWAPPNSRNKNIFLKINKNQGFYGKNITVQYIQVKTTWLNFIMTRYWTRLNFTMSTEAIMATELSTINSNWSGSSLPCVINCSGNSWSRWTQTTMNYCVGLNRGGGCTHILNCYWLLNCVIVIGWNKIISLTFIFNVIFYWRQRELHPVAVENQ